MYATAEVPASLLEVPPGSQVLAYKVHQVLAYKMLNRRAPPWQELSAPKQCVKSTAPRELQSSLLQGVCDTGSLDGQLL